MDKKSEKRRTFSDYVRMKISKPPRDTKDLPITNPEEELVSRLSSSDSPTSTLSQLSQFRTIAEDRETQYTTYDEMSTDSVIAAALEIYADDATQYDEQGRIIWVESEDEEITRAGNRLLDILEIPERAWKHIYQACKYGDFYLKLHYIGEDKDEIDQTSLSNSQVKIVNDKQFTRQTPSLEEYVEDVDDPATIFDLRKRGKTAGFIEVKRDLGQDSIYTSTSLSRTYSLKDVNIYRPDRMVHILVSESLSRVPETVTLDVGKDISSTYQVARGKSILYDVYPIQRELQLLEDSLLLNRLTRSSLIRLLEIEVGDMPKKEVNPYLRRVKSLIEQHVTLDKNTGSYKSYNSPGPMDNVIYIPTKNGRGHVSINNLGGDVNVRDIADIDYFNNKRAGALKIPRSYLGDDDQGSGLNSGGTLTQLSARYARTVKRIQTSYIRAITTLLNLFFIDKKLDYVNKFKVRMTSPTTQDDISRNDLINGNVELISSIMSLLESLEGDTQKEALEFLVSDVLKMPKISEMIKKDKTPAEEVEVDGDLTSPGSHGGGPSDTADLSDTFGGSEESPDEDSGFTDDEYDSFEDEI